MTLNHWLYQPTIFTNHDQHFTDPSDPQLLKFATFATAMAGAFGVVGAIGTAAGRGAGCGGGREAGMASFLASASHISWGNQSEVTLHIIWLVVSTLKNMSQLGWWFHIISNIWKHKSHVPNHQPVILGAVPEPLGIIRFGCLERGKLELPSGND